MNKRIPQCLIEVVARKSSGLAERRHRLLVQRFSLCGLPDREPLFHPALSHSSSNTVI